MHAAVQGSLSQELEFGYLCNLRTVGDPHMAFFTSYLLLNSLFSSRGTSETAADLRSEIRLDAIVIVSAG